MSNPFSGIITAELKSTYKNMIDALLEDDALTVNCRFLFTGTKYEDCANCENGKIVIGGQSSNPYWSGGTGGVQTQNCVYCGGSGKIPVEVTEDAKMIVVFDQKKFMPYGTYLPEGAAQTFSKVELVPKIKNCAHIILNTENEIYSRDKYIRYSEPEKIGWGQFLYVYTTWKRA